MNGTKRDFYFILTEEEDMGFGVSAIKANAWKYILISTIDTYIYLGHNLYGEELEKQTN